MILEKTILFALIGLHRPAQNRQRRKERRCFSWERHCNGHDVRQYFEGNLMSSDIPVQMIVISTCNTIISYCVQDLNVYKESHEPITEAYDDLVGAEAVESLIEDMNQVI